MSWLDFAIYFLSNQKIHAWSEINRTSLGNGFFWWVFRLLWFLAFSCFCLVRGEEVASAQDFGWQLKGEHHFRSWFPFLLFVHLVTILYGSDIVRSKDLSAHFFCFLSILDQELSSFLLSPILWLGIFFHFFFLSPTLWLWISLLTFFLWLEIFLPSLFFSFPHSLIGNFFSFLFAFSLIGNFPSFLFCFRG